MRSVTASEVQKFGLGLNRQYILGTDQACLAWSRQILIGTSVVNKEMSSLKHEHYSCLTYYCFVYCSVNDMVLYLVEDYKVRLLWENFERTSPKLVLVRHTTKLPKFF